MYEIIQTFYSNNNNYCFYLILELLHILSYGSYCKMYFRYEQSIFKFWICNNLYIVITRPEDIEFVLNNPKLLLKSKEYKVAEESIMGQGIFSISDIDKWKKNRLEMHI